MSFIIFLAFSLFLGGTLGELVCSELPIGICSYSIASSGKRCVLETFEAENGSTKSQCQTSEVMANSIKEHIESDQCIHACGLDRQSLGISTDLLADPKSVRTLCSAHCYHNCPNIVDLFHNLALAEGTSLRTRCRNIQPRLKAVVREAISPLNSFVAETPTAVAQPPVSTIDPPVMQAEPPVSTTHSTLSALLP